MKQKIFLPIFQYFPIPKQRLMSKLRFQHLEENVQPRRKILDFPQSKKFHLTARCGHKEWTWYACVCVFAQSQEIHSHQPTLPGFHALDGPLLDVVIYGNCIAMLRNRPPQRRRTSPLTRTTWKMEFPGNWTTNVCVCVIPSTEPEIEFVCWTFLVHWMAVPAINPVLRCTLWQLNCFF